MSDGQTYTATLGSNGLKDFVIRGVYEVRYDPQLKHKYIYVPRYACVVCAWATLDAALAAIVTTLVIHGFDPAGLRIAPEVNPELPVSHYLYHRQLVTLKTDRIASCFVTDCGLSMSRVNAMSRGDDFLYACDEHVLMDGQGGWTVLNQTDLQRRLDAFS